MDRRMLLRPGIAGGLVAAGVGGAAGPAGAAPSAGGTPPGGFEPARRDWRPVAEDVRDELRATWRSYRRLAWGHDQLLPVSGGVDGVFDAPPPVRPAHWGGPGAPLFIR